MEKKINLWGIIANSLLAIALVMSLFHIPNQALILIGGLLIMIMVVAPIFLVHRNKIYSTKKVLNISVFISLFFFIPGLFLSLQQLFFIPVMPLIIVTVLTGSFLFGFFLNEFKHSRLEFARISFVHNFILFMVLIFACTPIELQLADNAYMPKIEKPTYAKSEGSLIYVDEGHHNFHTLEGRLFATGKLLERDGYRVLPYEGTATIERLQECKILLIVNALNEKNDDWINPTYSAFTKQEIIEITQWVTEGGSLLMIADHMPFPGAIYDLAVQFGFEYENGHAEDTAGNADYFYRKSKTLNSNIITNGKNEKEKVDSILTFSGCAFGIPDDATVILKFDSTWVSYNPDEAWVYDGVEPFSIDGYAQGAYKTFGKGRVVVFGEAMMFTAQLGGGLSWIKIGMNSRECPDNYQLLLNSIHWLDGQME